MWFRKKTNTSFQPMEFGDYLLKQVTKDDWQAYRAFYLRALKARPTCSRESYDEAKRITPEQWVARLTQYEQDPRSLICAIIHKPSRELVGFVDIQGSADANISHQAWMRAYYILPEHEENKLPEIFLRSVFKHMLQFSTVRKVKTAIAAEDRDEILVLNALGFMRYGFDEGYFLISGKYKDAVLLLKRL